MTTQRDDLAREIFLADNKNAPAGLMEAEWETGNGSHSYAHTIADGLIAAGYTRPRTIDDVGQSEALKLTDIVLAYKGTPRHKLFEYPYRDDDSRRMIKEAEAVINTILTVLHEGVGA